MRLSLYAGGGARHPDERGVSIVVEETEEGKAGTVPASLSLQAPVLKQPEPHRIIVSANPLKE